MSQIFVSYSRESQDVVKTMVKDIEDLGHNVWFDQELTGGQAWWDQILDRILKCNIFVYVLTLEVLESHACKLELDYAYKLKKTILPILVADGVSINLLPTALSEIQFVDYRQKDKQAVIAVSKAINNLPAPQPLPDPLPKSPKVPTSYLGNLKDQIETTETLTFQEQSSLVLRLEEGLKEKENSNDVCHLLKRLRKREDLFAKVASKIDDMLSNITKPSPEPNPPKANRWKEQPVITIHIKKKFHWLIPAITVPVIIGIVVLVSANKSHTRKFRTTPDGNLSMESVTTMLKDKGFYDIDDNKSASGISNDYILQNGGKVVFDRASGLTWQQSGFDASINYEKAKTYIKKLNSNQFAGYSDWRLPTLEEAMSLMESTAKNGDLYIDPMFAINQAGIWTSDLKDAYSAWVVYFVFGKCSYTSFVDERDVRAVR